MRRRSFVLLLVSAAIAAGVAWWAWSTVSGLGEFVRDRYAIRMVPSYLRAYCRDHGGQLPPDLDALADYVHPDELANLRERVVMDPNLTVEQLLARRADLADSKWQPIRLRNPDHVRRPGCSISADLLSIAEEHHSEEP